MQPYRISNVCRKKCDRPQIASLRKYCVVCVLVWYTYCRAHTTVCNCLDLFVTQRELRSQPRQRSIITYLSIGIGNKTEQRNSKQMSMQIPWCTCACVDKERDTHSRPQCSVVCARSARKRVSVCNLCERCLFMRVRVTSVRTRRVCRSFIAE